MECVEASGCRVLPLDISHLPVRAWLETEAERAPRSYTRTARDENRRLLVTSSPLTTDSPETRVKTAPLTGRDKLVKALRPPYFMLAMIAMLVGVYWASGERARRLLEWTPGSWRREPWRVVSYGVVHASTVHLALNALVALLVGWRLEHEQNGWRLAALWLCGTVAGALGAGALQPHVRVVGASAAVYALLTAHLPNVCLRFRHVPLWWFRPLSVVVLCASEGCWALVREKSAPCEGACVAWAAHVVGASAGVPLGFLLFTGEHAKTGWARMCRSVSVVVLLTGLLAGVVYCAPFSQPAAT